MSVKPSRSGNGWEARWRENGQNKCGTFRTKRDAEEAERVGRDRVRARKHGLLIDAAPITYEELCANYLDQHQVDAVTIRTLKERLAYSREPFGSVRVRELRSEEISRWNAGLRKKRNPDEPLHPTTRGNALRAMRQVLEAGVSWQYLAVNPAGSKAVRMPTSQPREILPFESWDEVDALADAAGDFGALVQFACATGLRPQEYQALRWSDFDFPNRTVRVLRAVKNGRIRPCAKNDGSLRTVVMQQRGLDALRSLVRPLDGRRLVFPASEGGVINLDNFRSRVWLPAVKKAGLEHRRVYDMRHTFACLALSAGASLEWISRQLGHRDTRVTLRHYARFLPAADERALGLLDTFGAQDAVRKTYAEADA